MCVMSCTCNGLLAEVYDANFHSMGIVTASSHTIYHMKDNNITR